MSRYISRKREREILHVTSPKLSKFVPHIFQYLQNHPNQRCILVGRESTDGQRPHIAGQISECKRMLHSMGVHVIRTCRWIGRANDEATLEKWRKVSRFAKKQNAFIAIETSNRAFRGRSYHPVHNRYVRPCQEEIDAVLAAISDVPLVSIHDPDLSEDEQDAIQTRRGMRASTKRAGRPVTAKPGYKKRFRELTLEDVLQYFADDMPLREIHRLTKISPMTLHDWREKYLYGFLRKRRRAQKPLSRD
ncbi:MAG: hypothetical protein K8R87_08960 [Verrucomicrobia bacterium]|nr:hypothetical protein [Verrucomicrobiota bacterium]